MAATNLVFDTRVAPFLPNASQTAVNFGWTDPSNSWLTDASADIVSTLTAFSPNSLLYRPGSGAGTSAVTAGVQENSLNQRAQMSFVIETLSVSNGPGFILKSNNNNASLSGYFFTPSPSLSTLRGFAFVNGAATSITNGTVAWVVGHNYTLDVECAQTNGTTTTFTVTITDNTTSTIIINASQFTNTAAALQNPATSGFGILATANGFSQVATQIRYLTDQTVNAAPVATAYAVTVPANGVIGLPNAVSILQTGITLTSPLSIAFTLSNGGSVTPNPVVLTSGQVSATASYIPTTAGSETISWAYSGGNAGMTGDGSQVETVVAPVLTTDPNLLWTDGWMVQAGGAYANNSGNYLKMAFTGTALQVLFDVSSTRLAGVTAAEWPVIRYSVDAGPPVDLILTDPGVGTSVLTLTGALSGASTHTLYMVLRNETQLYNRWTPNATGFPPSGLRVQSFVFSSGQGTAALAGTILAPRSANRAYVFGDSLTEGSKTSYPFVPYYSDSEATWTAACCEALGVEFTNYGFSGQAYSGQIGPPDIPHFGTAWPLRFSGQTKLSAGKFITNSGSALPKWIIINMGTNDAANNASKVVGSVTSVITAIKAASPASIMVLVLPFAFNQPYFSSQGYGAFLLSEYQAYVALDPTAILVSLGAQAGIGLGGYPAQATSNPYSLDQLHPGGQRSANLGAMVASYIVSASGGGGSVTRTVPYIVYGAISGP